MALARHRELAALTDDILTGRRRLIAWGGDIEAARVNHWQCPLPIAQLTDISWRKWWQPLLGFNCPPPSCLEDEPADKVAVLTHYHLGRVWSNVAAYMERFPGIPYFLPSHLTRMLESEDGRDDPHALDQAIFGYGGLRDGTSAQLIRDAASWGPHSRRMRLMAEALRARRRPSQNRRVALFIEQMNLGGAERQLCALATGFKRLGLQVTLITQRPWPLEAAHYRQTLNDLGIECREAAPCIPPDTEPWGPYLERRLGREAVRMLWHMPAYLVPNTLPLAEILSEIQPDLLVCHLDRPNLIGAMAGCMTGVPNVLMSARNVNPCHFPHFYLGQLEDLRDLYRTLHGLPGIKLSANSTLGAQSYAQWLDIPESDLTVIANGLAEEAFEVGTPALRQAVKHLTGIPPDRRLLLGVFRLAEEKNPLLFVEVAARLFETHPDLHAVICGSGEMGAEVRAEIHRLGLESRFTLLSGIAAMPLIMRGSTVLLHTSRVEGTPNALLEAQAAGLPIVCTRAGGSEDCLHPRARIHVHDLGDADGLTESCRHILDSPSAHRALARLGRTHVRSRHSVERLAEDTLAPFGAP